MIHSEKDDSAVSPVIGTILLVAITVVLVAIIATVVMGMSGNIGNKKNVGLTVSSGEVTYNDYGFMWYDDLPGGYPSIIITIYGGTDIGSLQNLDVTIEGVDEIVYWGNAIMGADNYDPVSSSNLVGNPLYFAPIPMPGYGDSLSPSGVISKRYPPDTLVVVTGTFTDGTSQVLYQNKMTLTPYKGKYDEPETSVYNRIKNNPGLSVVS